MDPGRSTRILQVFIQETATVPELHTLQPTRRPPHADRSGDMNHGDVMISWKYMRNMAYIYIYAIIYGNIMGIMMEYSMGILMGYNGI